VGYAKELALQQEEQGWSFSPGVRICYACLSDKDLSDYVREHATGFDCDFCDRIGKTKPRSIAFDDLMRVIGEILGQYCDRAVNVLRWDGEDQKYFGTTYDSSDLVRYHLEPTDHEPVIKAIIHALDDDVWCDRNPYSTTGYDAYETGWEQFCNAVKHRTRFFFSKKYPVDPAESDITPVSDVLEEIGSMVDEYELITTIALGAVLITGLVILVLLSKEP